MNLVLLLYLAIFAIGIDATVPSSANNPEKATSTNDVPQQMESGNQEESNSQDQAQDDKKVTKRSHGWNPWSYGGYGYGGYGWPWYGIGYGWYPGWSYYGHGYDGYGGYSGYRGYGHGGWYKGW
ncbi:PREDICTED: 5'-3' exoribonuclease 2-like [Habropoda laboriosa]|uniref:5'-3' exoribonuclease 2-like n=1 Tax=Habropoda laboriosa TaxID=597456 RepID=UPI00083D3C8B|nr:PREDICTED: 5'-3' exoribonuclease 2-like [Habropoda laboriosa]